MAVFRLFQVDLDHIDPHCDAILEGLQRVFRGITPVSPMGNDRHFLTVRILQITH